jgi:hypothetical protein
MLWIALAAQVAVPAPESPGKWFKGRDTPEYLIQRTGVWWVPVRVTVGPDGKILSCKAERRSEFPQLDGHTCGIIRRRAKFRPAQINGAPAYGVYRTRIRYAVAHTPYDLPKIPHADVDVYVDRLPSGLKSPRLVKVAFVVDASGGKSSCAVDHAANLERGDNDPELISIACEQVTKQYPATPASISGSPVVSVQNAVVQFSVHR